ncbi:hypothetical protein BASA81_008657 [Batrachochytrium salamandrivorans]|nr:hypothetical protein BASA81_008657 [Batrachochytrium salamandrivorans]
MVCPLRYIVAAVSVVLALGVLIWSEWDRTRAKSAALARGDKSEQPLSSPPATTATTSSYLSVFVSLFTGRYIFDQWQAYKGRV